MKEITYEHLTFDERLKRIDGIHKGFICSDFDIGVTVQSDNYYRKHPDKLAEIERAFGPIYGKGGDNE